MQQKIKNMLQMQKEMNAKVNPEWRTADYAWYDAIWVECAELLEHLGYKWWKKTVPNVEQAKLELIDIWHFGMSLDLCKYPEHVEDALVDFYESRCNKKRIAPLSDNAWMAYAKDSIRALAGDTAASQRFSAMRFFDAMFYIGMTFDDLYVGYVGKNVLNFFRQDHGYKEGTYIKVWDRVEDNECLSAVVKTLDFNSPTYSMDVYKALGELYAQLTSDQSH